MAGLTETTCLVLLPSPISADQGSRLGCFCFLSAGLDLALLFFSFLSILPKVSHQPALRTGDRFQYLTGGDFVTSRKYTWQTISAMALLLQGGG